MRSSGQISNAALFQHRLDRRLLVTPILIILGGALLLWLLLQRPAGLSIDVGSPNDSHFISGFFIAERTSSGESFRWANPRAQILLHGLDAGPLSLSLRMNGDLRRQLGDTQAQLRLDQQRPLTFTVAPGWRIYTMLLPTEPSEPALTPDTVFLVMSGQRIAGRTLTAPVDWINVTPLETTRIDPDTPLSRSVLMMWMIGALSLVWWRLDAHLLPHSTTERRHTRIMLLAGLLVCGTAIWSYLAPDELAWAFPSPWLLGCGTLLILVATLRWRALPSPNACKLRLQNSESEQAVFQRGLALPKSLPGPAILLAIIAAGVGLRLLAATRGHNYDFASFQIVAEILERGENVYATTKRYNYGPVWFLLLDMLRRISAPWGEAGFRYAVTSLLSLADIGIALLLYRWAGLRAASLVLLNPIAIIISGYHNQFDNLALLVGLLAMALFGDQRDGPLTWRNWAGLLLLGLSLATKHLLFALPLWLALKQQGWGRKLLVLGVPPALFLLSFAPFWPGGATGILQNVFLYDSRGNEILYHLLVPPLLQMLLPATLLWLLALVAGAWLFRRWGSFSSLLAYTGILVAFAPSIENQYLAIVVPLIAVFPNPWFVLYSLLGSLHLLTDHNGLHLDTFRTLLTLGRDEMYTIIIATLTPGLVWLLYRPTRR